MNVLILGSGGREHAFALKISESSKLKNLYIAPGNAGTANLGINLDILPTNFELLKQKAVELEIDIIVVGPEDPLVKGVTDFFNNDAQTKHITVVGPNKLGAQLEGSKEFSKKFMQRHNIPTAAYQSFTIDNIEQGYQFLETLKAPYVLKADGLAAGKGVLIIDNLTEAKNSLKTMLNGQFGNASQKVVIEEFLSGIEVSYFIITDGKNYKLLPEAKDYKRVGENNTGLNTGGMGAVSPVPFANSVFTKKVINRIIEPTINGLIADKIDYRGFIFFGLIEVNMEPYVIEYNVRMGDPETEAVLPRIDTDFLLLLKAVGNQTINNIPFTVTQQTATTVVMVAGGYPGKYNKGDIITGLDNNTQSIVYHAGTTVKNNNVVTNGGRVLAITSVANDKKTALQKCYNTANNINFTGKYFRTDIGFDI